MDKDEVTISWQNRAPPLGSRENRLTGIPQWSKVPGLIPQAWLGRKRKDGHD